MNNKKLKLLDIGMLLLTIVILIGALFSSPDNKWMMSLIFISVLILLGIGTYRYWITFPEYKGRNSPIFLPKIYGLGWAINPRNPFGMVVVGILFVVIITAFVSALIR